MSVAQTSTQSLEAGAIYPSHLSVLATRLSERSSQLARMFQRAKLETVLVLVPKSNLVCNASSASLIMRTTALTWLVCTSILPVSRLIG